jgi:hypothetical protein
MEKPYAFFFLNRKPFWVSLSPFEIPFLNPPSAPLSKEGMGGFLPMPCSRKRC